MLLRVIFFLGSIPFFEGIPLELKVNLGEDSSTSFNTSSKSGIEPLKEVNALNESCNGGINFSEATAIVAKNGTISRRFLSPLPKKNGNIPIEKISVIPKGSIKALGNSGKTSAFHINGKELSPACLYFFAKYDSELVK